MRARRSGHLAGPLSAGAATSAARERIRRRRKRAPVDDYYGVLDERKLPGVGVGIGIGAGRGPAAPGDEARAYVGSPHRPSPWSRDR